jgi:hypothetical protein
MTTFGKSMTAQTLSTYVPVLRSTAADITHALEAAESS